MTDKTFTDDFEFINFEVFAVAAPWRSGIEILIQGNDSSKYPIESYAFHLDTTAKVREAGRADRPTLSLRNQEAQQLMDQLWACGLRPSEVGSEGQLNATENHLKDMRTLVFRLLDGKDGKYE